MKHGIRMFLGLACVGAVSACTRGFGSSAQGSGLTSEGPDAGADTTSSEGGGSGDDPSTGGDGTGSSEGGSGTSSGTGAGGDGEGGMAGDTGGPGGSGSTAGANAGGSGGPGGASASGGGSTTGGAPGGGANGEAGTATSGGGAGGSPMGGAGDGGSAGTTSNAGSGGGGNVERECGPRFEAEKLLFYTTLDESASVTSPAVGSGAGATLNPTDEFHGGACGKAMLFGEASHYVRLPQQIEEVRQISFSKGTIDFWVQRDFEFGDGKARVFFTADVFSNDKAAFIRVHKRNAANGNHLAFTVTDGEATAQVLVRPAYADLAMRKNEWARVTATWDFSVGAGLQQVRLYVNGVQPTFDDVSLVRDVLFTFPTPDADAPMFIGNLGDTSGVALSALIDDFQIYGVAFTP